MALLHQYAKLNKKEGPFIDSESFWDDFAADYELIQQESVVPIETELARFLVAENLLPTEKFLDLAGGTGRYLTTLQSLTTDYQLVDFSNAMLQIAQTKIQTAHVSLIKQSQQDFFDATADRSFDIVFSAMNPVLAPIDLLSLKRITKKYVLILRMIQQRDRLFSPFEPPDPALQLNEDYQQFLRQQQIQFKTKRFNFTTTETVTKEFFHAYFSDLDPKLLIQADKTFFGQKNQAENPQEVIFELIYFRS